MTAMLIVQVGPSRAKEMIISCRHYTASELLSLGMLNQAVERSALDSTVAALATTLIEKKPDKMMMVKATINALLQKQTVLRPDLLLTRADANT